MVEHEIESADGGVHQLATCDEDQPPVVLGLLSPIDGERDAGAKDEHVGERNRQEGSYVFLVEHTDVEPAHDHGDSNAQHNHQRGERRSKPAEQAVDADFARADQSRLSDKEEYPGGEGGAVNPQEQRPWGIAVEEVGVDGATEAQDHKGGQQQGHAEIKIAA